MKFWIFIAILFLVAPIVIYFLPLTEQAQLIFLFLEDLVLFIFALVLTLLMGQPPKTRFFIVSLILGAGLLSTIGLPWIGATTLTTLSIGTLTLGTVVLWILDIAGFVEFAQNVD